MLHIESTPFNEAQAERRRELERRLEEDIEDAERMKESLDGMLSSFDHRLGRLETSILPIHRSTQKLTKLYDNINKSLQQLQTVIDYFDTATQEEPNITKGPEELELGPYLKSVQRMKDALTYLKESNYKAADRGVVHLKEILSRAIRQLDALFRKWLTAASTPIDTTRVLEGGDISGPPSTLLANLGSLCTELAASIEYLGPLTTYIQTYEEIRSAYLLKSLQGLAQAAREQDQKGAAVKKTAYVRGSSAFVPYSKCLLRLLKAERDLNNKLIPKREAGASFTNTIGPAVDVYVEIGEAMLTRVKRNLQRKETGDVYMLIDVVEGMIGAVKEYDGLIAYAGSKGNDIHELASNCKATTIGFFRDMYEDIRNDTGKTSGLSADGTVHELISTTLNTLKRLVDYNTAIDLILSDLQSHNLAPSFAAYSNAVLDALAINLESKSKGYKKPTLATLFLLNNYHFVHKTLKGTRLSNVVGDDTVKRFDNEIKRVSLLYKESWKPCLECLSIVGDIANIPEGAKNLSKTQREIIKERFKTFNSEFEDLYKSQKNYTVPDVELRGQLMRDVKISLVPMYQRFHSRWATVDFASKPEKYIKYSPESLEVMVDKFFDTAA
ncbi:Exocyst complex component 7 [Rhizophlyctis rosea]|nr:Exocyst complex component 7 [Rhizophlyctis rosea]